MTRHGAISLTPVCFGLRAGLSHALRSCCHPHLEQSLDLITRNRVLDPDPCDKATSNASESKNTLKIRPVSVPRYDLGPSECWHNEYDQIAIAAAAERASKPAR